MAFNGQNRREGFENGGFKHSDDRSSKQTGPGFNNDQVSKVGVQRVERQPRAEYIIYSPEDDGGVHSEMMTEQKSAFESNNPAVNGQIHAHNGESRSDAQRRSHAFSEVDFKRSNAHSVQPSTTVKRWSLASNFMDTYSEMPEINFAQDYDPMTKVNGFVTAEHDDVKDSMDDGPSSVLVKILRVVAIIFFLWDCFSDWWLVWKWDTYACGANQLFEGHFYKYTICGDERESARQILTIFTVFGSVFTLLQVTNVVLNFLADHELSKFRLFNPMTEVFIMVFLEEVPQAVLLLTFGFNCDCSPASRFYVLLALVTGLLGATVRYVTAFSSAGGCCGVWWRCCCCRDRNYLFKVTSHECFCECSIPCPVCCCTLHCHDCHWTPHAWMAALCKAAVCGHCSQAEASYGIRLMDNIGMLFLSFCIVAQGILIGLSA